MEASKWDATLIAAIIALGGVMISAFVAYATASRSVYVNAVTTARIDWIENVRKLVIDLREISLRGSYHKSEKRPVEVEFGIKVVQITEELRLTLGQSRNEMNILRLAEICSIALDNFETAKHNNKLLAEHTQTLLKNEWKRVKAEAAPRLFRIRGYELQKSDLLYSIYCSSDGNFKGCDTGSI